MSAARRFETVTLPARFAEMNNADPHQPVCIGLFQGDVFSHATFAANRRGDAIRAANKIRRTGVSARLVWLNVGPWCADLWVGDLGRRLHIHPDDFYGPLESEQETAPESTGIMTRPRSK